MMSLALAAALAGTLVACTPPHEKPADAAQETGETTAARLSATRPGATLTVEAPPSKKNIAADLDGEVKFVANAKARELSYYRMDGMRMGTDGERNAMPALSLIKLYLAKYVLDHGTLEDQYEALDMIADSSDVSASDLFKRYPESIDAVAEDYELESTRAGSEWGKSVTSVYDVVNFIKALREESPTHPILVAMAQATTTAEDGYRQDYGTAKLSNVLGSKWGWSDDKTLHSSVSFGKNFIVAASVSGSAEDLTKFVKKEVTVKALNEATTKFIEEQKS